MAICSRRILETMFGALIATLASQSSFGQLHSRPAGVVLVATLESLSVSATTPSLLASASDGASIDGSERVQIRTSWAVPADRTTLRLIGALSTESQTISGSNGGSANPPAPLTSNQERDKVARCSSGSSCTRTIHSGDAGLILMTLRAGDTNRADTRTKSINLVSGSAISSRRSSEPGSATFSIRVEAL